MLHNKASGTYRCAGCGAPLFGSDTKYDSGSGWPRFTAPVEGEAVDEITDRSHGMERTEVRCKACEGHLGHVFPDGPGPEGLRYCINSASLDFEPKDASDEAEARTATPTSNTRLSSGGGANRDGAEWHPPPRNPGRAA